MLTDDRRENDVQFHALTVVDLIYHLLELTVNKLITNDETRDDNNNRRVTPTEKCEPNHIKHYEINNGQSVELNIVFTS